MGSESHNMMGSGSKVVSLFVLLAAVTKPATCQDIGDTICTMLYCPFQLAACEFDAECRTLLTCMGTCTPDDPGCFFNCGLNGEAGQNEHFLAFLYCVIDHHCMDDYEESGACLATDEEALPIEDYGVVAGDWWTVYGQSCGQANWTGAYDWVPCSHARIFELEDDYWINNTTFCAGQDSVCDGEVLVTIPQVYWTNPGVLRHDYPQTEAPLVPQLEDWKWMWINGDWAFVIWCGSNPMLAYNGAFILSRNQSDGTMPEYIRQEAVAQLAKYGLTLEGMCLTDSTQCAV